MAAIPIQNIFYLLTYAWNKLDEAEALELNLSDYSDATNLFSRVLVSGSEHILKRGLDRAYLPIEEDYAGVKGKLNIHESLTRQLFNQGKTNCSFDEFSHNILHNRILKSTLRMIANLNSVDKKIKTDAWACFHRFQGVDEIELNLALFRMIHLHRNNAYYGLPINIARFLIENLVFDENAGEHKFKDFLREDRAMALLFEEFVRNFFAREQSQYKVRREDIKWQVMPVFGSDYSLLPKMQTDITLESETHKLIIDTKYYSKTASEYYGVEKFHASNLYQLNAYLSNLERDHSDPRNQTCDGMLLYPKVDKSFDETYKFGNHSLRITTLDLNQDWKVVHKQLLEMVSFYDNLVNESNIVNSSTFIN